MGSKYEDKDGNAITREEAIEQYTNDSMDADEDNFFTREEQEEFATFVVDRSKDGTIY